MTLDEAQKIIQDYGGAVAKSDIKRSSNLPCSKARIKYAYFTYLPALYEQDGGFYGDLVENLVQVYAMLNSFIDDGRADSLEQIKVKAEEKKLDFDKPKDKELIEEYLAYMQTLRDGGLIDEISEYMQEIQARNME
jgi:hypothetical protein